MGFLSMLNPFGGGGGGDSFSSGGIGNSKSAQSNATNTSDLRNVGGDGSINSSSQTTVDGSNNVLTMTDHGAVAGGLALAMQGIEGAQALAQNAQDQTSELMAGIFKENAAQASNLTQAVVDLKTSDVRTLVIAGMAVVGLVAVQMFKKTKA